jgi:hypothetical protein
VNKAHDGDRNDIFPHGGFGDSYSDTLSIIVSETGIVNDSPMPPTALVTETAAVRTPSAMVKLVPNSA